MAEAMISRLLQWPFAVLLLVLGRAAALSGDGNVGSGITYPVEEGLTFYEKDSVDVSWTSKFETASLLVFCWEGPNEDILTLKNNINNVPGGDGSYIVLIDFETTANHCWFNLRDNDKDPADPGVNSAGFALSATERSQTTLGLQDEATTTIENSATSAIATTTDVETTQASETASETVIETTSETASETAAKTVSETAQPAETSSDSGGSSGGLSTGAKAGIGIGFALGVLGIFALGGAYWLVNRRKSSGGHTAAVEKDGNGISAYQQPKPHELPSGFGVPTMPQHPPQEMPG